MTIQSTSIDWGDVTEEVITGSHDPLWVYIASKTLAERAVWTYAEENPSLDVATSTNVLCTKIVC